MRQKARSLAKVSRPQLKQYLSRGRLYGLLDGLRQYPVIWVSGPAGCGKTTLVNSYLKERRIRCLWYQVNESDADPATFFYYMRHAAKVIAPRRRKCLPLLTPEYQPSLMHFTVRYFEDLFGRMPARSSIVLDNYQDVPEDSVFHAVMRHGLAGIPDGVRVIIISRTAPPAELARLEVNQQMGGLSWNDLRLSPDETSGIVELLAPKALAAEKVQDIHYLSDGWVAGIVLMVRRAKGGGVDPHLFFRQSNEVVFDYFAGEVFEHMTPAMQDFLLRTAFLPSMSVPLAGELTGSPEAGHILTELARHNYFVERRFTQDAVYSYHPLFRLFLLTRARQRLTSEAVKQVITDAAILLEHNGQVDEALELIRETGDWGTMTMFLMQHAPSMLAQGRNKSLERWLVGIPGEVLQVSPWLLFWLGVSRLPFDQIKSMGNLEDAYTQFKEQNDVIGIFLTWSALVSTIIFSQRDFSRFVDLLSEFEQRREIFDSLPLDDIRARVAGSMFSLLVMMHPEHPETDFWGDLALELTRKTGNLDALTQTLFMRSYLHITTGTLHQIAQDVDQLLQLYDDPGISDMGRLSIKSTECMYCQYAGLHNQCLKTVEDVFNLSRASGIHVWDIGNIGMAIMSCQNISDYAGATRYQGILSELREEPTSWIHGFIYGVRTRQSLINGDLKEAARLAELMTSATYAAAVPATAAPSLIIHAQVEHCLGDDDKALDMLSRSEAIASSIHNGISLGSIGLVRAWIAFDKGQDEHGLAFLRDALPRIRELGWPGPIWDIPAVTASLCARALEAGIETDFVRELIRKRNLVPREFPLSLESWPWPVKVYTLGQFQILKNDELLRFSKKAQRMPLDMLKVLIARGGTQVGEIYVADMLWPEADGDLALQSCATTLHRLRKLLGHHEAIQMYNALLTVDRRYCWVDAWVFENLMDKADSLWDKAHNASHLKKACEMTCSALELHKGTFLPEETWNPDVISLREHLRQRYFRGLYRLGDYLVRSKQWEEARKFFERGLTIDDCAEGCYQGLMACLQKLGHRMEALAVFDRCRRTLDAKLGIIPSLDTEALVRSLRSGLDM